MLTPFPHLLYCSWPGNKGGNVLLAASGSKALVFNIANGNLISQWSHTTPLNANDFSKEVKRECENEFTTAEPPEKRRKLSYDGEISEAPSTEIVVENNSGKSRRPKNVPILVPSIIKICATSNNKYLVVVTGEDKSIHVLELLEDGTLKHLSRRVMPKRPSSIRLASDQKTVLCGDKFGDVYALPLLISSRREVQESQKGSEATEVSEGKEESRGLLNNSESSTRRYVPAASSLTVHSKKNLIALKSQQQQTNKPVEKKTIEFEHQLLLGHVSLLTDLLCITTRVDSSPRNYILTSDRDEHIRVSRGIPQSHIIEGYCLGHTQFVSKMCIPLWKPEILISGGGDDYILIWDWRNGTMLQEIDIKSTVEVVRNSFRSVSESGAADSIAVSGIWAISTNDENGHVIITCEAIPALLIYNMDSNGTVRYQETLIVEGNVLDITFSNDNKAMFYSIDNVHQALTTDALLPRDTRPFLGLFCLSQDTSRWIKDVDHEGVAAINRLVATKEGLSISDSDSKSLSSALYGIEHLRKRAGTTDDFE